MRRRLTGILLDRLWHPGVMPIANCKAAPWPRSKLAVPWAQALLSQAQFDRVMTRAAAIFAAGFFGIKIDPLARSVLADGVHEFAI
jgi:hypothetical protein